MYILHYWRAQSGWLQDYLENVVNHFKVESKVQMLFDLFIKLLHQVPLSK